MKKQSSEKKKPQYGIVAVVALVIALILIFVFNFLFKQVSSEEAQQICEEFYAQVEADISAVPGYSIVKNDKRCEPNTDEMGSTDYMLDMGMTVVKKGVDSVDGQKSTICELSSALSEVTYNTFVSNTDDKTTPYAIQVSADKLLQEDGSFYFSGPEYGIPNHNTNYFEENYASKDPC